jgi:hypothetical protein
MYDRRHIFTVAADLYGDLLVASFLNEQRREPAGQNRAAETRQDHEGSNTMSSFRRVLLRLRFPWRLRLPAFGALLVAAWLAVCLVMSVVPVRAQDQAQAAAVGQVVRQQGAVAAQRDGTMRALHLGAAVYQGDRVFTGSRAKVAVEFRDGSSLTVGSATEVEISEYILDGGGRGVRGVVSLIFGIVRTSLSDLWRSGFEVRARAAVASVRSTDWVTESQADKSSVFVVEGTVAVAPTAGGAEVLVPADNGTDVPTGGVPAEVKRWGAKRVTSVLERTRVP